MFQDNDHPLTDEAGFVSSAISDDTIIDDDDRTDITSLSVQDTTTTSSTRSSSFDTDDLEQIALDHMTEEIFRNSYFTNDEKNEILNYYNDGIYQYPSNINDSSVTDLSDYNSVISKPDKDSGYTCSENKSNETENYYENPEDSDTSSFYDDEISNSELEYFSSEWDDYYDNDEDDYYDHGIDDQTRNPPMPKSRTIDKLNKLLAEYQPLESDDVKKCEEKKLQMFDIQIQYHNYCKRKKILKTVARHKIIEMLDIQNIHDEAMELMNLEILDKKLHRNFYYQENEPKIYKNLLEKRIRAIIRKYNRYVNDDNFRDELKEKIRNVDVHKIKSSPLFDHSSTQISVKSSLLDNQGSKEKEEDINVDNYDYDDDQDGLSSIPCPTDYSHESNELYQDDKSLSLNNNLDLISYNKNQSQNNLSDQYSMKTIFRAKNQVEYKSSPSTSDLEQKKIFGFF